MKNTNKKYLTILGRVKPNLIPELPSLRKVEGIKNTGWFFVDFSQEDFPEGYEFDIYVHDDDRKNWDYKFRIKLLSITDQFKSQLTKIEKGYKSICCFQFSPSVPSAFSELPVMSGWKYQKRSLIVGSHESFEILENKEVSYDLLLSNMEKNILLEVKNNFSAKEKFSVNDLMQLLNFDKNILLFAIRKLTERGVLETRGNNNFSYASRS